MFRLIFSLILAALVSACASTPYVSTNYVVRGGVANLGDGREVAVVELCRTAVDLDAKAQAEVRKNPALAKCAESQMQTAFGTTWTRDVISAATPAVVGAITQGQMAKSVARETDRICRADGSGCGKGGGSVSSSGAGASANVVVNLGCGTNCASAIRE